MADFPGLEPTRRSYDFGVFPLSTASAFGGGLIRFTHGDAAAGQGLTLEYVDLLRAEMQQIRAHYRGQQGGYLSFLLPDIIWLGLPAADYFMAAGSRWKYAEQPKEEHKQGDLYDVTVALEFVGFEAAVTP